MGGIEGRKEDGHFDEVLIADERTIVVEQSDEWRVDEGMVFAFYDENIDLDATETNDVLVVTGSRPVHISLQLEGVGGSIIAQIYEGVTTSSDGTPVAVADLNRITANVPETTVFKTPTITGAGTLIAQRRVLGGDNVGHAIASASVPGVHRVLAPMTKYLFRQTGTVNDTAMTLTGTFHEH